MDPARHPRVKKKDRTGVWISVIAHVAVIAIALFILSRTELGKQLKDSILGTTRAKDKAKDAPKPPPAAPRTKGPPKALDAPPAAAGPRGRAADAPPAVGGEGFAVDAAKIKRDSAAGTGGRTNVQVRVAPPPVLKPPPKLVTFAAAKTDIKQLLVERQKATVLGESFGTEQISKSGASDASDIIGRVAGASLAEGKFAVVRGLADRYTLTTLNGADIPSADPSRRAVQLDLFPAQFISKVDVSKTFQPDLPGGFAGGALNIVTRSFPDKALFTMSYGVSYNTQASLRDDFLITDHGSTDWLALDDGKRALPAIAAATSPRGDAVEDPRNRANGLGDPIKDSFGSRQVSPVAGNSPLNQSMAVAMGDTAFLFGKRFGFLAGMNYKQEYNFYDDGTVAKYDRNGQSSWTKTDAKAVIEYAWGSMVTLAYELHQDHQLGFNFLYVQTAEDEARRLRGRDSSLTKPDQEPDLNYVDQSILHWTERNLTYFQLQGKHEFEGLLGLRVDWVGSLASTSQDEPDQRVFQYFADYESDPENPFFQADGPSTPAKPTRIFRNLEENNMNFRTDWTLPVPSYNSQENSVKGGYSISKSEQSLFARTFEIRTKNINNHPFTYSGDPASFLAESNNDQVAYFNFPANSEYVGNQTISAWYGMGTWSATEWMRLVGGVRLESTALSVDTVDTSLSVRQSANIAQNDVLPAFGSTFLLRSNLQLRAAWSETVVRPTYREISSAAIYDVALGRTIVGNTDLQMSASENYDARLEWYPRPGELVSVGVFKKKIDRAIELSARTTDNKQITYFNYDVADVKGFEIELRKEFRGFLGPGSDQFSLGFNYAYIKSEVDLTAEQQANRSGYGETTTVRPLYDQPEFVVNGDLTWDNFISGTSITLNGGVTGRRLVLVGLATPDEYEEPAPFLDVSVTQRVGRRWKAKFSAKNLLNPVYNTTQTWPLVGSVPIKSNTKGMSFGVSLSCEF